MTSVWRSSLANVETALRRSLGLSGPVNTELQPQILTPVVIAHDATAPGGAVNRRRHFSLVTGNGGVVADDLFTLVFTDSPTGVVITGALVSSTLTLGVGLNTSDKILQFPPGLDVLGGLVPGRSAMFTEGVRSVSDFAPLWDANGTVADFPGPPLANASDVAAVYGDNLDGQYVPLPGLFLAPPPDPKSADYNGPGVGGGLLLGPGIDSDYTGDWLITLFGYVY